MKKPFAKKTETIEIRVAPEAKDRFIARCERNESSASAVLRELMDGYASSGMRTPSEANRQEFRMAKLLSRPIARFVVVTATVLVAGSVPVASAAADPRIEALFIWLDRDGDSGLSIQELMPDEARAASPVNGAEIALTSRGPNPADDSKEQVFAGIDGNGDGRVSLSELDQSVDVTSRLDESILTADQDGDSLITAAELAVHIAGRRAAAGEMNPAVGAALLAEGLVGTHDGDGDGRIGAADLGV